MMFAFINMAESGKQKSSKGWNGNNNNSKKNHHDDAKIGPGEYECVIKRELIWQDTKNHTRSRQNVVRCCNWTLSFEFEFSHIRRSISCCIGTQALCPQILINTIIYQPNRCHISHSQQTRPIVSESIAFQCVQCCSCSDAYICIFGHVRQRWQCYRRKQFRSEWLVFKALPDSFTHTYTQSVT